MAFEKDFNDMADDEVEKDNAFSERKFSLLVDEIHKFLCKNSENHSILLQWKVANLPFIFYNRSLRSNAIRLCSKAIRSLYYSNAFSLINLFRLRLLLLLFLLLL